MFHLNRVRLLLDNQARHNPNVVLLEEDVPNRDAIFLKIHQLVYL